MDNQLIGTLSTSGQLSCSLSSSPITGELTVIGSIPSYQGSYEITPSDEAQTIYCADMLMEQDVIINPVQGGYAKVTVNGSILTIS